MAFKMLGTKLGMTRVYNAEAVSLPVTVIQLGPCTVTQIRTVEKDGYSGVQLAYADRKARTTPIPLIAHDAKAGASPKRYHREFRCTPEEAAKFSVGQVLTVKEFEPVMFVDVSGTSKGKGFQGTMKRHNFKGMFASHGTERKHRSPGSIGSLCSNRGFGGGLKKGKKMAGHMGSERVTVRSLDVVRIDPENNLLLVKGPVPGPNRGMVEVRTSTRLYRSKAKKVAGAAK
jgi:large subunit ribosomal protein L3